MITEPRAWGLMDDKSINLLGRVVDLLAAGKLYLLAGAGLSRRVGIPGWNDLLKEFAREYKRRPGHSAGRAGEIIRLAKKKDLELFEVMKNDSQGQIALIDVLRRYFYSQKCDSVHASLLGLPFKGVVTTNYDTCFESACTKYRICQELVKDRWFCFPEYDGRSIDMDRVFDGNKFLLHMHGCFYHGGKLEVENIILTPSQYYKFYLHGRKQMERILGVLASEHVLFLGTSLTDRYFLDSIRCLRKPNNQNERANAPDWFRFCDGGKDCFKMRDEEDLVMHHIHYEKGNDGFGDAVREMVNTFNTRKRGVDVYVDPKRVTIEEDFG